MICALVLLMTCVGSLASPITTRWTSETTSAEVEITKPTAAEECGTGGTSINSDQKTAITAQLNSFRYYSPHIEWDETLASLAQTRAETCPEEKQNHVFDCAEAEVDEIVEIMPQSEFDVATFTEYMYKSAEYSSFPQSYIRWYTCNPTIVLYMAQATKVGCGYSTCDAGITFVCIFSPKGPEYCNM